MVSKNTLHVIALRMGENMSKVKNVEHLVEQTMLYDFYGELLTQHQQHIYEDVVWNDMSLTEIAQDYGISRQAVHDMMKRINKILEDYESKLHLVAKFERAKEKVRTIRDIAESCGKEQLACKTELSPENRRQILSSLKQIETISGSILEDF